MEPINFKHGIEEEDGNSALNSFLEHAELLKKSDGQSSYHNVGYGETVDILKQFKTQNTFQTAPKEVIQFSEV